MISWRNWIASRPPDGPHAAKRRKGPGRWDPASERGWPLRITLLIAVTVALLPIAVVSILQGIERARIDVAEVHDRLAQSAEGAAAGQENLLLSAEQIARALGNIGSVRRVGRDCDAVLGEALVGVKYFANISRLDSRGRQRLLGAALGEGGERIGAAGIPARPRCQGASSSAAISRARSCTSPVIVGMWPLHDDKGRFDGVVSVVLQLHWLDSWCAPAACRRAPSCSSTITTQCAGVQQSGRRPCPDRHGAALCRPGRPSPQPASDAKGDNLDLRLVASSRAASCRSPSPCARTGCSCRPISMPASTS